MSDEPFSAGSVARQLDYWKTALGGLPPVLELPADRPRPARQTYRGAVYRNALPASLTEQVKSLSDRESATPFMTLLATFQALLHCYTGLSDIAVGTPIANRTRVETESLIQEALQKLMAGRTTLIIAHRLSTIRHATNICVLDQGRIVQFGPHERLVAEEGPYRRLYARQYAQTTA